ncbi:MAG: DUF2085 domain-containing protein [Candidatus Lokiarchaeota archaeon]|nr:DUF2085 domain-containing protein [Candidatus Harpocratesius repetitus]
MASEQKVRYYNPSEPLKRNILAKILIFSVEFMIVWQGYYVFSLIAGNSVSLHQFSINPSDVFTIPISFWISVLFLMIISKIFNRYIVLLAAIFCEIYIEYYIETEQLQLVIIGFLIILIVIESIKPYEGGEYLGGKFIWKQLAWKVFYICGYLPILYFGFNFQTPISFFTFDGFQIRFYLSLIFLFNNLILIIPAWLIFWLLDRSLHPYFPLSNSDMKILQEKEEKKIWDLYNLYLPQPGEVYLQILSHHSIEEDDHTIVVALGKVRIYFCTRCTAMIFGVIFTFFLSFIIFHDFNMNLNTSLAFWLGTILPIFPLLDWGLQALQIRKATTQSRLFTGFILGVSMQLIPFALGETFYYIFVVVGYFTVFGVLFYFRTRLAQKEADQEALQEILEFKSNSIS